MFSLVNAGNSRSIQHLSVAAVLESRSFCSATKKHCFASAQPHDFFFIQVPFT
jgi:hypothetical protein